MHFGIIEEMTNSRGPRDGRTFLALFGERADVAPCRTCRPWIFFINGVHYFLKINGSRMEKEER